MTEKDKGTKNLRQKAEKQIKDDLESIEKLSPGELKRRIHELKVYQIELEMQNEALRQTQFELAASKDRYFDLYHKAPVGHVTVDESGVIRELNASFAILLGLDPTKIKDRHFFQFVNSKNQGDYLNWFKQFLTRDENHNSLEIWMNLRGQSDLRVQMYGRKAIPQPSHGEADNESTIVMLTIVDITEKWHSQNELDQTTTYLNRAIEIGNLAWWHMNVTDGTVHFHRRKTDMLGYRYDEFYGKKYTVFTDLIHPDDFEKTMQNMRNHLEGNTNAYSTEYRIKTSEGSYRWFLDFGKISEKTPQGAPLGITGIVFDITEHKQNLIDSQENEQRYRLLAEHTEDLVCLHEPNGKYLYISPSVSPMLGYKPEELIGGFPYDFFHPEDIDRIRDESHKASLTERKKTFITYRFRKKNNEFAWLETYTIPVLNDKGDVTQLVTSSREVSERIRMEETINEDRLLLSSTIDAIRGGIVVIDNNLKVVQYNKTMEQWAGKPLLGLNCREVLPTCPGDCEKCFTEQIMQLKNYRQRTIDYLTADGEKKTLSVHSYPLIKNDVTTGVVQFADDITDITLARLELEKSEALSRLILNSTPDAIFIIDRRNMRFIDCNEEAYTSLGMTREELLNSSPHEIKPEYDQKALAKEFDEILNRPQQSGILETVHQRKDGSTLPVEIYISATDYEGQILLVAAARNISDRLKASNALRQSEARYAMAQDVAGIGSWEWNLESNDVFWSDEIYPLFGLKKTDKLLTYEEYLSMVHTEDRQMTIDSVNNALETKSGYEIEHRIIWPNGQMHWVHGRGGVILDSQGNPNRMVGIVQDITERKLAEQQMQMLSYVVEHGPAIIIVTDHQGTIEYVNSKFTAVTGYSKEEAIGENPRILKSGNKSKDDYKVMWQTISSGKEWHGEVYNKTKDGRFYWAQVSISSITNESGHISHYIGIQEDISNRKGMELDLLQAKEAAERANQAKSTFLASMSHELRTPLNAVLGFAQVLKSNRNNNLTEKELGYTSHILSSGEMLLDLINDVLDLSKIESGRFDIKPTVVSVTKVTIESIDQVDSLAKKFGIKVKHHRNKDELFIHADERGIKQVLLNILSNAIKYNQENGEVNISYHLGEDTCVCMEIRDTGPGIPQDKVDQLFQPFNRLGAETTNIEGTGIGLTITERLVTMMDGKISVESVVGEGTTFYLKFPVAEKTDSTQLAESIKEPDQSRDRTESVPDKKCVLNIEDNKINLKLIESILGSVQNLDLVSAPDAETGIEMAKELQPNIILMDINLPGMDGYEALKRLRQIPETSTIPVIAVTAEAMEGDEKKAIDAGFVEYIPKPIQVAAMKESIMRLLSDS